jgi:hypothetical protein
MEKYDKKKFYHLFLLILRCQPTNANVKQKTKSETR